MSTPSLNELHQQAMTLADLLWIAKVEKRDDDARAYARQAFELEEQAALLAPADAPVTWAVLHRSAAWLALDAGLPQDAIRLAHRGLTVQSASVLMEELQEVLAHAERELTRLTTDTAAQRVGGHNDGQDHEL